MFHQIQQAVEPRIDLIEVISRWKEIKQNLAEYSRKRRPQMENRVLLG